MKYQIENKFECFIYLYYSTAREFFSIPPIPVGQTVLPTAIPLKHYLKFYDMHTVTPLQSHWVSNQMGGITVGYKTLILSTQVKQGKLHRSDSPHCNPTQSSSETLPEFSLQCFHRYGWIPSGVRFVCVGDLRPSQQRGHVESVS